jgi:WD40 repeat protein
MSWRADGRQLVTAGRKGVVKVWDAATGKEVSSKIVPPPGGQVLGEPGLSLSPDGRRLALVGPGETLRVWDGATDKVILTLPISRAPRHEVMEVAWSPDGRRLVASVPPDRVQVWDAASGKELFHLDGIKSRLPSGRDLAGRFNWAPDGRLLATGLPGGDVEVWDVDKGQTLFCVRVAQQRDNKALTEWLSWSPDGQRLAAVNPTGTVTVWKAPSGQEAFQVGVAPGPAPPTTDSVAVVVGSPDGRRLASASATGAIRVWEADTGQVRLSLEEPPSAPSALAWGPDGKRLAVSRASGTVEVWDTATGKAALTLRGGAGYGELAWSPDGKWLAVSGPGTVRVWDLVSGKVAVTVRDLPDPSFPPMAWSADGRSLGWVTHTSGKHSGSLSEEVQVWDAARGKTTLVSRRVVPAGTGVLGSGRTGRTISLAWSPAGRWLAAQRDNQIIATWVVSTGAEVLTLRTPRIPAGTIASAWSPEGKRLAAVGPDGTIKIGDPSTGKEILSMHGRPVDASLLAWSPDGKQLASATAFLNKNIWEEELKVWDTGTGKALVTLPWGRGSVGTLEWSPDGKRLAAVSRNYPWELRAWDAATFKETLRIAVDGGGLSWAPDGRRLATGGIGKAKVWDVTTGKEVLTSPLVANTYPGLSWAKTTAWSPDGRRLAVTNPDWTVRIWDVVTSKEVLSLGRSRGLVHPAAGWNQLPENRVVLAWSGDGKRLASSASLVRTIQVWDPATGAKISTLPGHPQQIRSLAWSRDGKRLASAADDGAVKVWDMAKGKETCSLRYSRPPRELSVSSSPTAESLLAWSADGAQLAVAGGDGAVTVWDVSTGKLVNLLVAKAPAYSVAWSPNGRRLASVGGDGTVSLWDPTAGQQAFAVRAPLSTPRAASLAWSPDGRRLALGIQEHSEANSTITVWDSTTGEQKPGPAK